MSDKLKEQLEKAAQYEENHGSGRVIREVLYALEREYGAEEVSDQFDHLKGHDSAFSAVEGEN